MARQTYHQGETIQLSISTSEYDLKTANFVVALYRECVDEAYIFEKNKLVETTTEEGKTIYTLVVLASETRDYLPGVYTLEIKINDSLATHVATAPGIIAINPAQTKNLIN